LADTPEAPRNVEIGEVSRSGIVLQWDLPRHDGGSPVSGYVIERAQAYSNRFLRLAHLPSAAETTYRDVNVHDGYEYEYRVCAENEAGEGPFGKVIGPITARDRFGANAVLVTLQRRWTIKSNQIIYFQATWPIERQNTETHS